MARRGHKHVPQRTCVGCREVLPKRALVRVVRTGKEVRIDATSKLAGRGAYIHAQRVCWERALHGPLARALRIELSPEDRQDLVTFMDQLTERQDG